MCKRVSKCVCVFLCWLCWLGRNSPTQACGAISTKPSGGIYGSDMNDSTAQGGRSPPVRIIQQLPSALPEHNDSIIDL